MLILKFLLAQNRLSLTQCKDICLRKMRHINQYFPLIWIQFSRYSVCSLKSVKFSKLLKNKQILNFVFLFFLYFIWISNVSWPQKNKILCNQRIFSFELSYWYNISFDDMMTFCEDTVQEQWLNMNFWVGNQSSGQPGAAFNMQTSHNAS